MNAGALRHRIVIQTRADVADGLGGVTSTWSTLATVWARIEPKSAKEQSFAGKTRALVTHRITIRAREDVTTAMRVTFAGRTFQIHGVRNLEERGRVTELDCEEGSGS